ncbi:BA14K family protein [Rhizobium halophytocola]|uniref:Lectin-like protein BA14k n=1 Tax=Rhizobium halophytocola TaxID=735519 RepID=A0ABS4DXE4_9HYPH|nr:BA14K family protein [Rhizobium halophytocola]MBP1850364.1 hypothetical protein [Rhizobium halophytocola]
MFISIKGLAIAGLTSAMIATSFVPSQALPLSATAVPTVARTGDTTNVVDVQYRRHRADHYRGYRGYRSHRRGYRYHNGYWFPLAAFATGAIIGGAVSSAPARSAGINPKHYAWCESRYRSYDARSNTFQPYNGPRQQCTSPYY